MGSLIFDTTFLIDFQREKKKGHGRAHQFFLANQDQAVYISVITLGEFGEGFSTFYEANFLSVIEAFEILPVTEKNSSVYAAISRKLRANGNLIEANDLWIASIALESGFPLVAKNRSHFARIPNLEIITY